MMALVVKDYDGPDEHLTALTAPTSLPSFEHETIVFG
jgi:hypothetical protein